MNCSHNSSFQLLAATASVGLMFGRECHVLLFLGVEIIVSYLVVGLKSCAGNCLMVVECYMWEYFNGK